MSTNAADVLPATYRAAVRTLLRYAIAMAVIGLLAGLSFQESAKKLPFSRAGAGLNIEATIGLALVHGHIFTAGVLMPLAMAGAMLMARRAGGREVSGRALKWLLRGYLPAPLWACAWGCSWWRCGGAWRGTSVRAGLRQAAASGRIPPLDHFTAVIFTTCSASPARTRTR